MPAVYEGGQGAEVADDDLPEEVIFDKAEEAETREELKAARKDELDAESRPFASPDGEGDGG